MPVEDEASILEMDERGEVSRIEVGCQAKLAVSRESGHAGGKMTVEVMEVCQRDDRRAESLHQGPDRSREMDDRREDVVRRVVTHGSADACVSDILVINYSDG